MFYTVKLMRKLLNPVISQQVLASIILLLWVVVLSLVIFKYYQAEEYGDISSNDTSSNYTQSTSNYINTIDDLTANYYGLIFESALSITPVNENENKNSDDLYM